MYLNSGVQKFSGKRVVIFLETLDNPLYYQYVYAITKNVHADGGSLHLVFIGERTTTSNLLHLVRYIKKKRCRNIFATDLKINFNAKVSNLSLNHSNLNYRSVNQNILKACQYSYELRSVFPEYRYLGQSLHSYFCSSLSLSSDPLYEIRKHRRQLRNACIQFQSTLLATIDFKRQNDFDLVIFTNGRTPEQAVFKEFAESYKIPWMSLEHGAKPGESYHLEDFQTQDRLETQNLISKIEKDLSSESVSEINNFFENWSLSQMTDVNQNSTLAFRKKTEITPNSSSKVIPIFTSSIDEEVSCPNWSEDNIRNLLSETIRVYRTFVDLGWEPIVVIHPNTLNKKWHDLSFMLTELMKHGVRVGLPWDSKSSYQYLNDCKFAVTWRSTIGLEAIVAGKSLAILSDATYDKVVNLNPASMLFETKRTDNFRYPDNEIFMAKLVIFYYTNYGRSVRDQLSENDLQNIQKYQKVLPLGSLYFSVRNRLRRHLNPFKIYQATPKECISLLLKFLPREHLSGVMLFLARKYSVRIVELPQNV